MTTVQIDRPGRFQYSSQALRNAELIAQVAPSGTIGNLQQVVVEQVSGYSTSAALRWLQLHNQPQFPPFAGEIPLISIPVPAGMPFAWTPPGPGFVVEFAAHFGWIVSGVGHQYNGAADSAFWLTMQGRASGPATLAAGAGWTL